MCQCRPAFWYLVTLCTASELNPTAATVFFFSDVFTMPAASWNVPALQRGNDGQICQVGEVKADGCSMVLLHRCQQDTQNLQSTCQQRFNQLMIATIRFSAVLNLSTKTNSQCTTCKYQYVSTYKSKSKGDTNYSIVCFCLTSTCRNGVMK